MAKIFKMSANVIDCHLANVMNNDISLKKYSKHAKTATVRPIFKKDGRAKIKNYRPVSLLNIFLKIYERFLHENLTNYMDIFLSKFISAYCKSDSSGHVLICLIEHWKKSVDQKKFVGAVLMNLSKAFDSIPHNLLIAKFFQILLSGVPQGHFYSTCLLTIYISGYQKQIY